MTDDIERSHPQIVPPPFPVAATPMSILSDAVGRGATIETIAQLMTLQERWEKNEARKAFDDAIASAKAEIPAIKKNRAVGYESARTGDTTSYRHEDFAEVARVVTPVLARYGLSFRFRTDSTPGAPVSVTCIISHRLGYSEENTLRAPPDVSGKKNSIQAIGSTVTYLQRYTLKAALGVAAEHDDDTAGASEPQKTVNPETGRPIDPNSSNQLRKNGAWESFVDKLQHYRDAGDLAGLQQWYASEAVNARIGKWPPSWREQAHAAFQAAFDAIEAAEKQREFVS